MTKVRLPNGQEMTIDASVSDIEYMQRLIALHDRITYEINLQANNLLSAVGARGNADSFNRLKTAVDEMHALLSNTVFKDTK